jgi:hypothetical protein
MNIREATYSTYESFDIREAIYSTSKSFNIREATYSTYESFDIREATYSTYESFDIREATYCERYYAKRYIADLMAMRSKTLREVLKNLNDNNFRWR